jgi:hypothetical protein
VQTGDNTGEVLLGRGRVGVEDGMDDEVRRVAFDGKSGLGLADDVGEVGSLQMIAKGPGGMSEEGAREDELVGGKEGNERFASKPWKRSRVHHSSLLSLRQHRLDLKDDTKASWVSGRLTPR